MRKEINKLIAVWQDTLKTSSKNTELPKLDFEALLSPITSIGPFYYYIVDFFDMSISHVSPSIYNLHGFNPTR